MILPNWIKYFENVLDGVALINKEGKIHWSNQNFAILMGATPRRLKDQNVLELLNLKEEIGKKIGNLGSLVVETPYYRINKDFEGLEKEIGICFSPVDDSDLLIFYLKDFSLEKDLHDKYKNVLRQKEVLYKNLQLKMFQNLYLNHLAEAVDNKKNAIDILNKFLPQMVEFFNFSYICTFINHENTLMKAQEYFNVNAAQRNDLKNISEQLFKELNSCVQNKINIQIKVADQKGVLIPLNSLDIVFGAVFFLKSASCEITSEEVQMIESINKQTALYIETNILREHALTDALTKIFNVRTFNRDMENLIKNKFSLFSLLFIDVDFFKKVNDNYGHAVGDKVLQRVAQLIHSSLDLKNECVYRYGGEEFSVILKKSDTPESYLIAEKIRKNIESKDFTDLAKDLKVTVSIGISTYPIDSLTKENLIEFADKALYLAKHRGRNQCIIYSTINLNSKVS